MANSKSEAARRRRWLWLAALALAALTPWLLAGPLGAWLARLWLSVFSLLARLLAPIFGG